MKVILVFFTLSSISCNNSSDKNEIVESLHKTFDYLLQEQNLNVDGLFGIVLSKVLLESSLESANNTVDKKNLNILKEKAHRIFVTILPTLPTYPPKYKTLNKLLDVNMWRRKINFEYGALNLNIYSKYTFSDINEFYTFISKSKISEDVSDECFMELLLNTENIGRKSKYCISSQRCLNMFVNAPEIDPAYGVTHRLLYIQIARARNCILDKDWFRNMTTKYCSYIMWEAKQTQKFQNDFFLLDLLLEQILVCGYEGFAEFLNNQWLHVLLNTQHPKGCYRGRFRREANFIKYGCTDHTTGLAAADLALYYYFLIKGVQQND